MTALVRRHRRRRDGFDLLDLPHRWRSMRGQLDAGIVEDNRRPPPPEPGAFLVILSGTPRRISTGERRSGIEILRCADASLRMTTSGRLAPSRNFHPRVVILAHQQIARADRPFAGRPRFVADDRLRRSISK